MSKQIMIGLIILVGIVLFGADADAGCLASGYCAWWISASGMTTGISEKLTPGTIKDVEQACIVQTRQGPIPPECDPEHEECPGDSPSLFQVAPTPITMRVVGTAPTAESGTCGFNSGEFCDIEGVAICTLPSGGETVDRKARTRGPLELASPDFGQTDGNTSAANYRFQLDLEEQERLCAPRGGTFKAFIVREGFFQACAGAECVSEFCKADLGGITRDVPRLYHCRPVATAGQ
jgi:hypothetical protein